MEGLVISVDVSNGYSHFKCFTDRNKTVGKVHEINHDVDGFHYLLEQLSNLKKKQTEKNVLYMKPLKFIQNH